MRNMLASLIYICEKGNPALHADLYAASKEKTGLSSAAHAGFASGKGGAPLRQRCLRRLSKICLQPYLRRSYMQCDNQRSECLYINGIAMGLPAASREKERSGAALGAP
jgi:hypothetical protein